MVSSREGSLQRTAVVPSTVRFSGGPLDGRVSTLPPGGAVDGHIVTHVYLHGGPKIETHYRLCVDAAVEGGWEYRVLDRRDGGG